MSKLVHGWMHLERFTVNKRINTKNFYSVILLICVICTSCGEVWSAWETRRAGTIVNNIQPGLTYPPSSKILAQGRDLIPMGNGDVCAGSDVSNLVGTNLSRSDVEDFYRQQFDTSWQIYTETGKLMWLRESSGMTAEITLLYLDDNRELGLQIPTLGAEIIKAKTIYRTPHFLTIYVSVCRN